MALRSATFRLEQELLDGLKAIQERDGVPQTEQVRRAIRAWLEERGITPKKRAAAKKR